MKCWRKIIGERRISMAGNKNYKRAKMGRTLSPIFFDESRHSIRLAFHWKIALCLLQLVVQYHIMTSVAARLNQIELLTSKRWIPLPPLPVTCLWGTPSSPPSCSFKTKIKLVRINFRIASLLLYIIVCNANNKEMDVLPNSDIFSLRLYSLVTRWTRMNQDGRDR